MKILILFFLFLFFHSAAQTETIKIRKPLRVIICGLDSGIVSVDTLIKYPMLKISPRTVGYEIKEYSATINDDVHRSWWNCKGDTFCSDLIQEIINTDRNKMTLLRVYDIVVIDKNKDTLKVNSIGLLLQ